MFLLYIAILPIGLISGAAVIVVLSLLIAIIVPVTCSFAKRKASTFIFGICLLINSALLRLQVYVFLQLLIWRI